uniref:Putative secreted stromal cell-derived factor 2 n=1 Tax=Ixodes scapularis TaxID=6945 RepID=A0A4D5RKA0_IXOSC
MAAPTTSMSWCHLCALFILIVNFLSSVQGELRYVTCGSVLKLQNTEHGVRLHSHDIKYGSGSGQQSVTGTDQMDDNNSHWVLKAKRGGSCPRGEPVACGSTVRLEHLTTHKNLHSHHFVSPLSNNQEISAFGDSGEGDTGDNWTVVCSSDFWERGATVRLKHVDTDMWLCASGQTYGRPIGGQMEICGLGHPASSCYWKTAEGVYLREGDATLALRATAHTSHLHQEL